MKSLIVLFFALFLAGCGNYATDRYSISTDNAVALRSYSVTKINVGDFVDEENLSSIACQYHGPVTTLDGETFASFLQKAFTDELKMAGIYSKEAPVTISGRLDEIDYSTAFSISWELKLTLISSTGKSATVSKTYKYKGSIFGTPGGECAQAALAFVPAVQNLNAKIIEQLPMLTKE
jgi:hypothetical protein